MTAETVDLSPLRARGLLSHCGLTEAAPERVVEMTVERIECDRHELARLRAANDVLAKAAQEPGRRGLRARLKTAETELAQARRDLGVATASHKAVARRAAKDATARTCDAHEREIASLRADIARMTRARSEGEARLAAEVVRLRAELQQARIDVRVEMNLANLAHARAEQAVAK